MSKIHLKKNAYHTLHDLPELGSLAPSFTATQLDLSTVTLDDFKGKPVLINVYPSIDTQVCFQSAEAFQKMTVSDDEVPVILCISMDLPFALKRVALGGQFNNITFLSDFRNREFGDVYGLTLIDGPLAGLLARAVIVLDKEHRITYQELVTDIATQPAYDAAFECAFYLQWRHMMRRYEPLFVMRGIINIPLL
jgi:thioredoxin-dependent peroxiredoxin